jgi:hypothetical protein
MTDFEEALTIFCGEDAGNLTQVRKLRADAFAKIVAGGGQLTSLLSGSLNGKSHTVQVDMNAKDLFSALTRVLAAFNDDSVTSERSVIFDFSQITR